jgi:hypothetical protein
VLELKQQPSLMQLLLSSAISSLLSSLTSSSQVLELKQQLAGGGRAGVFPVRATLSMTTASRAPLVAVSAMLYRPYRSCRRLSGAYDDFGLIFRDDDMEHTEFAADGAAGDSAVGVFGGIRLFSVPVTVLVTATWTMTTCLMV